MQNAARAVTEENQHLRALLARHGVSSAEIEQCLRPNGVDRDHRHGEVKDANEDLPQTAQLAEAQDSQESPRSHPQTDAASPTTTYAVPTSADLRCDRSARLVGQDECDTSDLDERGLSFYNDNNCVATKSGGEPVLPPRTGVLQTAYVSRTTSSGMEMPCELAAAIIADVQGHGDQTLLYPALGCSEERRCLVRNAAVFDLIDKNI